MKNKVINEKEGEWCNLLDERNKREKRKAEEIWDELREVICEESDEKIQEMCRKRTDSTEAKW